jgi:resuscitation-promoting factor RpfB
MWGLLFKNSNQSMKLYHWLASASVFFLLACRPSTPPTVNIIDTPSGQIITLQTDERVPSALLDLAGLPLNPNDRVLYSGLPIALDQPITDNPITLQIRRAAPLTLNTPGGQQQIQSSAFTVGEALQEAGYWLRAGDKIAPGLNSLISDRMTIMITSTRELTVSMGGKVLQIQSSARTIGEALAEAGLPLLGLDYSIPAEEKALPSDGQIRVVRVNESLQLAQKPIPFESDLQASADGPLAQTPILQPGENGVTVQRIRIRYEDGDEISRVTEDETLVRPPKTRLLGYGTKVETKTASVDGVEIEYWRAVQMYATSYSPCRSGVEQCLSGTSSGETLKKGMVGLRYDWYVSMQGQRLFIPGYGFASVEDVCGGCVGKPWIDLGYSDNDYEQWNSFVTVYFLTPVPVNLIYVLD